MSESRVLKKMLGLERDGCIIESVMFCSSHQIVLGRVNASGADHNDRTV
jgi:hypothetical protein